EQVLPPFDLAVLVALAVLDLTRVRERLAAIVTAQAWEAGPSLAERPARLRGLAARVDELELEHAKLPDQATELARKLEPLPENGARKLKAQRDAERREREELQRRASLRGNPQARRDAEEEIRRKQVIDANSARATP